MKYILIIYFSKMEKIFFSFLLFISFNNDLFIESIIKIPFKFYPTNIFFPNQTHPLTQRYMSQIVIELKIGTPPQKLNLSLHLNTFYSLYLNNHFEGIEVPYIYNKSLSTTFNCTDHKKYYYKEDFGDAEIFNDKIYLNDDDNNGNIFNFLLIYTLQYGVPNEFYSSGIIGLRLKNENSYFQIDENRFLYQIRKYFMTKTEIFYFNFDKKDNEDDKINDNGNLIIGEDLFDDDNNFLKIKVGYIKNPTLKTEWSFNFDAVYYGNIDLYTKDALIKTENGLILGPTDYEVIIKQFFINSTKCYSNHTKMGYATYRYYYCDNDFDENTMETLKFQLTSINYSFIFTGKDLFFKENGVKYFKILFLYYQNSYYWYLGRHFLHKYRLRFDTDRKLMYIPLKQNKDEKEEKNFTDNIYSDTDIIYESDTDNKNNKKNEDKLMFYQKDIFWIIIALSILIISLLVFIIVCLKKYPRKKRMNEMEEDIDYDYKNSEDTKGIN